MTSSLCGAPVRLRAFPSAVTKPAPVAIGKACALAFALAACAVSGLVYAATTWSLHAQLERAAAVTSNSAAKRDQSSRTYFASPARQRLTKHSRLLPSGEPEVTWRGPDDRVVYRNDPRTSETIVMRGTRIPLGEEIASEAD